MNHLTEELGEGRAKAALYGIGSIIVFVTGTVAAIGIILSAQVFKTGVPDGPWALFCQTAGALLTVSGLTVWFIGVLRSDMDTSIAENRLQTGGIYAGCAISCTAVGECCLPASVSSGTLSGPC